MKNILNFDGKTYISSKRASDISGYSSDYIGQLCRSKKLDCKMIGRSWFVTQESVVAHRALVLELESSPSRIENLRGKKISYPVFDATSEVSYSSDERPLLPVLDKNEPVPEPVPESVAEAEFVPKHVLSIKPVETLKKISTPFFSRALVVRRALASSMVSLSLILGSFIYTAPPEYISSVVENLRLPAVETLTVHVSSILSRNFADNSVDRSILTSAVADRSTGEIPWNGIAVAPTSDSRENEMIKEKIRASFSDEVKIEVDESGTAGVVTPVFRKATSTDFVYVLVPVKDSRVQQ